jgi:hypothetical protein
MLQVAVIRVVFRSVFQNLHQRIEDINPLVRTLFEVTWVGLGLWRTQPTEAEQNLS